MKAIGYAEYDLGDRDKVSKKNAAIQEERKKFHNRYPKGLSEVYYMDSGKLFRLYEGTEEQFANLMQRWVPEMSWHFVSIFTVSDGEEAAKRI